MKDWQSRTHVKWEGKSHAAIVPNCRTRVIHENFYQRGDRSLSTCVIRRSVIWPLLGAFIIPPAQPAVLILALTPELMARAVDIGCSAWVS